jgi:protocatechuate 3,4-dioxygenase beta subunit
MFTEMDFSRRELITVCLGGAGSVLLFGSLAPLFAKSPLLIPTSEQAMGPFYPVVKPVDEDADLTVVRGKPGKAEGQILYLGGRILNLKGEPQKDARVEIWQANARGRYTHPLDTNKAPLDPHFEGYGVSMTDAEGRYSFKTIKPARYPAEKGWTRPPHIHFQVTTPVIRFVTQMYFPGEALNEKDRLFATAENKKSLIAALSSAAKDAEPGSQNARWDIILPRT